MAIHSPQRPGMRPDGMGRLGSLIASTCRSNQSFTAWLAAQMAGPANTIPAKATTQWVLSEAPEETAPHMKAHMGANHVTGFNNSNTAEGDKCPEVAGRSPIVRSRPLIAHGYN